MVFQLHFLLTTYYISRSQLSWFSRWWTSNTTITRRSHASSGSKKASASSIKTAPTHTATMRWENLMTNSLRTQIRLWWTAIRWIQTIIKMTIDHQEKMTPVPVSAPTSSRSWWTLMTIMPANRSFRPTDISNQASKIRDMTSSKTSWTKSSSHLNMSSWIPKAQALHSRTPRVTTRATTQLQTTPRAKAITREESRVMMSKVPSRRIL